MESKQQEKRQILCVTTAKPCFAVAGGGGALALVCPNTGSISSSLAVSGDLASTTNNATSANQQLGMSSLSMFPSQISDTLHPTRTPIALAYGGKGGATKDCAAMLVSLSATNPKAHWKARLPEANLTAGIVLTPCGHYAIGGGSSGSLYVWSTLEGRLLKTLPKAHYRSVTCICMSEDQRHVLTGGADGMVHLFALWDLVSAMTVVTNIGAKTVTPIRTWPQHAVPITALACLSTDRMISASQDGVMLVLETFSEAVVAKIQLPQGVQSLAVRNQRVWLGGSTGTLFCLDLDEYAMHQTIQLGARIARRRDEEASSDSPSYQTTLKGHQHPVTSLAVWGNSQGQEFLASGDAFGTLRVWDLVARVCVRVVRPWSSTAESQSKAATGKDGKKNAAPSKHPISSIGVVSVPDNVETTMATSLGKKGNMTTWASRLPPLQKYATSLDEESAAGKDRIRWTPVPLWNKKRDLGFWDVSKENYEVFNNKRPRDDESTPESEKKAHNGAGNNQKDEELKRLRKQLEEANSTISRWEKVNNELVAKLKTKK
jgi:WD domain, G-beta repeat